MDKSSDMGTATRRGAMIVLEGLDRSGKTTQASRLASYFEERQQKARIQRFPDRSEPIVGPVIDNFLKTAKSVNESQEVIHLLFAANRWAMAKQLHKELAEGTNLIVDRYSFSGIAYSLAKGLEKTWVCQPEIGLPRPDLVLFFDVDPSKTKERAGFGDEVMEKSDFQRSVYVKMRDIYDASYWKTIDASDSIENVHSAIVREVEALLKKLEATDRPIQSFAKEDFGI